MKKILVILVIINVILLGGCIVPIEEVTDESPVFDAENMTDRFLIGSNILVIDIGITATDLEDGDLTSVITANIENVNILEEGHHMIHFEVEDSDGNNVAYSQEIRVITANQWLYEYLMTDADYQCFSILCVNKEEVSLDQIAATKVCINERACVGSYYDMVNNIFASSVQLDYSSNDILSQKIVFVSVNLNTGELYFYMDSYLGRSTTYLLLEVEITKTINQDNKVCDYQITQGYINPTEEKMCDFYVYNDFETEIIAIIEAAGLTLEDFNFSDVS